MEGEELDLHLAGGPPPGHLSPAAILAAAAGASRAGGAGLQRARGHGRLAVGPVAGGRSAIRRLHQAGSLKLRFPRVGAGPAEAVLVNAAGGLTGGDRLTLELGVEPGAALSLATQAAERVYRSAGGAARFEVAARVGAGSGLSWLPQETILFDGGRIERRLDVECEASSRLLLAESVVLGRHAMGESVREGLFRDSWRVRRAGRLVFADELRLDGAIADDLAAPALLGPSRAFATLLLQAGEGDEPRARLAQARAILGEAGGASAFDGLLLVRLTAADGLALRRRLVPLLTALASGPLPQIWSL